MNGVSRGMSRIWSAFSFHCPASSTRCWIPGSGAGDGEPVKSHGGPLFPLSKSTIPWQTRPRSAGMAAMSISSLAVPRPVIYQLLVRTFGNTNETRKFNGTLAENGCGKFNDINDAALTSLKTMGFTHLWLTGVLEQASGTQYPHRPADAPDILKGIAGSPYAIKDYFDVCPDYAVEPDRRLEEFKACVDRCHALGFKVIIDFVPNHVARSYASDVKPELSFGEGDRHDVFFHRDNHFYYLRPEDSGGGPPLKLPTASMPGC